MKHSPGRIIPLSAALKATVDRIEKTYHGQPAHDSFSTGFRSLDDLTGGFHRGDLVAVVSDDPDLTTAVLLSSVHALVARDRIASLFVSARHDEHLVTTKLLGIESGIAEIELRSAMLDSVHRSALNSSANSLHEAPLHIAAVDTLSLQDLVDTLGDAGVPLGSDGANDTPLPDDTEAPGFESIIVDGFPMYHRSEELVLHHLREIAVDHDRLVVLSSIATPEQRDEWRFDRWFDVILQVGPAEMDAELIQVDVLQNRHGAVGTTYLQYDQQRSVVHDIDDTHLSWTDLYTSLRTINARHGETLRRLGEGVQ